MTSVFAVMLLAVAAGTAAPTPAPVAKGAPVEPSEPATGSLRGVVRFVRSSPVRLKQLTNDVDEASCGSVVTSDALLVGVGGALANVVVEINGSEGELMAPPRPAPSAPFALALRECKFVPRVLVVPPASAVELLNEDGLLHDVVSLAVKNLPSREHLPRYRRRALLAPDLMARTENVELTCERHTWTRAWIVVKDNAFVAVTGADGRFSWSGVVPGPVRVTAWHEELGSRTAEATVPEGGAAELTLVFD